VLTPQAVTGPAEVAQRLTTFAKLEGKPVLASFMGGESVAEAITSTRSSRLPSRFSLWTRVSCCGSRRTRSERSRARNDCKIAIAVKRFGRDLARIREKDNCDFALGNALARKILMAIELAEKVGGKLLEVSLTGI
jgi:acyl-CoA synthetase (NDP forming)